MSDLSSTCPGCDTSISLSSGLSLAGCRGHCEGCLEWEYWVRFRLTHCEAVWERSTAQEILARKMLAGKLPVAPAPAAPQPALSETLPADSTATVGEDKEVPWESNPAWEDLQWQQKRVLRFMHGRESASIEDLARAVWGDADRKDGTIRTALSRTNEFLRLVGDRRTLTKRRGEAVVRWE